MNVPKPYRIRKNCTKNCNRLRFRSADPTGASADQEGHSKQQPVLDQEEQISSQTRQLIEELKVAEKNSAERRDAAGKLIAQIISNVHNIETGGDKVIIELVLTLPVGGFHCDCEQKT